jgi:hypothetical protein
MGEFFMQYDVLEMTNYCYASQESLGTLARQIVHSLKFMINALVTDKNEKERCQASKLLPLIRFGK